ncbi:hypothetical protein BGX27_011003 [Mortierella sp. AM989]|nr:hypothetical protein BGX27_011003 [Mortierella sp. AM989]
MAYYVSWMKLLKTISTGNKSPKSASSRSFKSSPRSSSVSQFPSQLPDMGSISSRKDNSVSRDPYSRFEGHFARLAISGETTVRGFPCDHRNIENEGSVNSNGDNGENDDGDGDDESDDNDDDGDMSGLRQNQVQVGWGGNCTSKREIYSPSSSLASSPRSASSGSSSSSNSSNHDTDDEKYGSDMRGLNITPSLVVACSGKYAVCRDEKDNNNSNNNIDVAKPTTYSSPQQQRITPLPPPPTIMSTTPTLTRMQPFAYGRLIRVLNFSHLYYVISDKFLTHLFPQTPLLSELYIYSPKQFSDESLDTLAISCPLIQRLELVGCTKISDAGLSSVLDSCLDIHTLVLSNNGPARITDKTLSKLAMSTVSLKHHQQPSSSSPLPSSSPSSSPSQEQKQDQKQDQPLIPQNSSLSRGQRFRVLNLSCASNFITGQNPGLTSIAIGCTNLVSLDISHYCSQEVTDELLRLISVATSTLKRLNIAYCSKITDRGLIWLAKGCPDLRELDITAVHLVTDRGILEIGKQCRSFKRLVMDDKYGSRISRDMLKSFPWGADVVQKRIAYGRRGSRTF